ncbi:MAG: hypothetical protein E7455_06165 [Ruminococcaceae bacterium]|nr:hypothetical protein [Oscillospiraceae bacterium]
MDALREYLIGVIAAALLCGIVTSLIDPKGTVGFAVKLIAGLLMLLSVVRPWVSISFDNLLGWTDQVMADGSDHVASGQMMADDVYRAGIKEQLEAYIVDEAKTFGCELSVEIILSDEDVPVPEQVRLKGDVSPYAKQSLTNFLSQQLGIDREDQIWT